MGRRENGPRKRKKQFPIFGFFGEVCQFGISYFFPLHWGSRFLFFFFQGSFLTSSGSTLSPASSEPRDFRRA